ncbi:MAG: hypothetical protein V4628_13185 [Pseudomonadota bacterium]
MNIAKQTRLPTKRLSVALTFVALFIVASQTTAQPSQSSSARPSERPSERPSQQPRAQNPDIRSRSADYQVWVGLDSADSLSSSESDSERFPELISDQASAIAGVWSNAEFSGLELALQMDGNFSLATNANPGKGCSAGVERGRWSLSEETRQLRFYIKTDTNGPCGFSDPNVASTIRITDTGLLLRAVESSATNGEVLLIRR